MFAAFDVGDDVGAFDIRQSLRRQNQFHFHRSLADQIGNQIRIFCGDRAGRNFRRIIRVICLAGVRKPIVGATD